MFQSLNSSTVSFWKVITSGQEAEVWGGVDVWGESGLVKVEHVCESECGFTDSHSGAELGHGGPSTSD